VKLPVANGKYRKSGHRLAVFLGGSALAVWIFHFCLWYQYDGTRPVQPDAFSGRVYPLNTHGHFVYLDEREDSTLTGLTVLAVSLFGIGFVIEGLCVEGFSQRRTSPWEKKQW
jgi:hypothetical protein